MDAIYLGASATIVALHGQSADSGLPDVGVKCKRIPQSMARFGPHTVAERFPTLDQAVASSSWVTRGWTYQESALSRRRILFSQHQIYFRCQEITCCESLDSAKLFGPLTHRRHPYDSEQHPAFINPLAQPKNATGIYSAQWMARQGYRHVVNGYVNRELSREEDILKAISGLLNYVQRMILPDGFFYGIPRRDFRRSLGAS